MLSPCPTANIKLGSSWRNRFFFVALPYRSCPVIRCLLVLVSAPSRQRRVGGATHAFGLAFMPPEPLPWDRKDFLKERKHERSESFGSIGRWRDSSHHARGFNRWGSGEIRRLPGHGRQRSWHMFSEESSHGYCPSWTSGHKMLEDERGMPSVWRGDGKHGRNGRESRSFNQRDWRGHSWETSNGHRNSIGRPQYDGINDHRSVDGIVTYPAHSQSQFGNTGNEIKPKDSHDRIRSANTLITGQKCDRENSVNTSDCKPIKWTRTASLSSRGSSFNNSSSSKSLEISDTESKSESLLKNGILSQPPPTDLTVGATSSPLCEDPNWRKKPRLGWGEGLAKYEKKKTEDPDAGATKEAVFSHGSGDTSHSCGVSLSEKNPVAVLTDCASPATPSVACSSSPVVDEKSLGKTSSAASNLCSTPSKEQGSQGQLEGFSFILERTKELDTSSFATLGSSLTELLQSNDLSSTASEYVRSAAIDKLLLCKSEISKELEVTESEIDSLENELKLLISATGDGGSSIPTSASPSLPLENTEKYSKHHQVVSTSIVQTDRVETVEGIAGQAHSQVRVLSCLDLMEDEAGGVGEDTSRASIVACNQELAKIASEVFNQLLAGCENKDRRNSSSNLNDNKLVEEKVAGRKQLLKFQERVLGLKFNALQQSWKEANLVSTRKSRTRPQKLSLRTSNSGHQKHRSSTCSRFSSPAGNVSAGTRGEMVDFAGKLLSESQGKACRNILKMPALILDKKERLASKFSSSNGLVEDPCAVEEERSLINPWTSEEREIFMDKLALFGKDFGKIASFLDHKATADCVEFYYKNHKSDDFQKTKRKLESGKNEESVASMYLVTIGKKQNPEIQDSAYLDMLGAASEMVAYEDDKMRLRDKLPSKDYWVSDQTMSFDFTENGKEAVAADVLAGIGGSLSSEAMSSCITSSIDPAEGYNKLKRKRVSSVVKQHLPQGIILQADDETWSDESCGELEPFDWTDEEKSTFVQSVLTYGKDFGVISKCVRTKTRDQCRVFFSKARKCLGLDLIPTTSRNLGTSVSGDDGNGGSDIEDACILESGSFTCGDKFFSKMDEDSRQSAANVEDEDSSLPETSLTNQWRSGENNEPSSLNHQDDRILAFDMGKEKDRPLTIDDDRVGVVEIEGGLGGNVPKICPESFGYLFGEQKNVETGTIHRTDLPCLVEISGGNGSLLAGRCEDPSIISSPHEKSSERDGYGKGESSNQHSIKEVASSVVPNSKSLQAANNRMDGDYYLERCCSKPQSAGNEPTFQLDKHEVMCKTSKNGGNVKLFGKILDHLSSLQTEIVSENENEEIAKLSRQCELGENDLTATG